MMPADTDVKVHGYPELARGSLRLADNIDRAAQEAFGVVADRAAIMVRGRVPKRTGRLASSVHGQDTEHGAQVGMGDGVPYAGWIEYGGGHGRPYIAAGRYLNPTAQDQEPTLVRSAETVARQEIGRMRWPTVTP